MPAKLSDILNAIDLISSDQEKTGNAFLHLESGEIILCPEPVSKSAVKPHKHLHNKNIYLSLPSKQDLELASKLPAAFADELAPALAGEVRAMFRHQGALGRFKDWADRNQLLDAWYRFEKKYTRTTVRNWCVAHHIRFLES
ncbi:MAG: hypothetical protein ACRCU9_00660 [Iodobacter sp.]